LINFRGTQLKLSTFFVATKCRRQAARC